MDDSTDPPETPETLPRADVQEEPKPRASSLLSLSTELGLSKAQADEIVPTMVAVVWRVGCPGHMRPLEVVHDAFVLALRKPLSKRPPVTQQKRFFAWLCKLAEFAALSNRKSKHQRLLGEGHSDEELSALKTIPGHEDAVAARQLLQRALPLLNPEQLALVNAVHFEGKTLKEIADEKNLPQSTVGSRYHRALQILRAAIKAMLAALLLFYATKLRAFGSHVVRSAARLVPQATQTASAMAVTVACGVLVPANAVATVVRPDVPIALRLAPRTLAITANMRPMSPSARQEVEPVKPKGVDTAPVQCSGRVMKSTAIARYVQETVLPFAFLLAPAVTSVACAGTERQPPPPQQAGEDEEEGGLDPYEIMCLGATRMGAECPTRAEWYKSMGRCPDGQKGCQD